MQRNFAGFHSLYGADYLLKAAFSRYAFIDVVVCAIERNLNFLRGMSFEKCYAFLIQQKPVALQRDFYALTLKILVNCIKIWMH